MEPGLEYRKQSDKRKGAKMPRTIGLDSNGVVGCYPGRSYLIIKVKLPSAGTETEVAKYLSTHEDYKSN